MGTLKYLLIAVALFLSMGCPTSENPLPSQGDITEIASPYLGDWLLTGFLGETDGIDYMVLNLSMHGDDALSAAVTDGTKTDQKTCFPRTFDSDFLVSILSRSEEASRYAIAKVVLEKATPEVMKVFGMDSLRTEEAITEGRISGKVIDGGDFGKVIDITDSSANLEAYVTSSPEVFDATPIWVFTRQE